MAEQHEWGRPFWGRVDWDGRQCKKCGVVASNAEIAVGYYDDNCPGDLLDEENDGTDQ